jgi:hypothetical protein
MIYSGSLGSSFMVLFYNLVIEAKFATIVASPGSLV